MPRRVRKPAVADVVAVADRVDELRCDRLLAAGAVAVSAELVDDEDARAFLAALALELVARDAASSARRKALTPSSVVRSARKLARLAVAGGR